MFETRRQFVISRSERRLSLPHEAWQHIEFEIGELFGRGALLQAIAPITALSVQSRWCDMEF